MAVSFELPIRCSTPPPSSMDLTLLCLLNFSIQLPERHVQKTQSELWGPVGSVASHTTAMEGSWCVQRLHLCAASSLSLDSQPIVLVIWQELGPTPPSCKIMGPSFLRCSLLLLCVVTFADAGSIGVNYGRIANNLPSAVKVALDRVKVYDTDPAVLKALSGSGVKVTVDLPNGLLYSAAKYPAFARSWVQKNVVAYHPSTQIEAIAVGNEVFVDPHNTTKFLIPAMKNIHQALVKFNLHSTIKVSSPIALSALQSSYPSSAGSFRPELIEPVFKPMLDFLRQTGSYLMVNAYPFFAYESNSDRCLRLKYDDVKMVVTETGWPSKGDENEVGASVENAAAYNGNLIRRILTGGGTPLRPQADLTVYLFALFNENEKDGPTSERNYGLFYPDQQKVYDIPFTVEGLKNYKAHNQPPLTGGQQVAAPVRGGVSKSTTGNTWCVANPDAGKERLQAALDFACGEGGADCRPIQPESTCYNPNTLEAHSSFAFNSYYQKKGRGMGDCYFGGAAYVVTQEPSAYFTLISF
ncbi:hypothetical protein OIU84_016731 [Salix udensis]|uniref:glucan endo-1,3-beta-D-glucosidase n=1 Tax=Salix udensis TaxID=889485 RepID=A0AAD6JB26_9ROSI|nr:hypothetical protein OIU84_016731 [Salix udensis]